VAVGCRPTAKYDVVGFVRTEQGINHSFALSQAQAQGPEPPVAHAKIWLTYDSDGKQPIRGFDATSDETGYYRIRTENIPPATDPDGNYFLVVEKEGYDRLIVPIRLGLLSRYGENTLILKSTENKP